MNAAGLSHGTMSWFQSKSLMATKFLAASYQIGAVEDIMQYADEASFLEHFISRPISEWFDGWDPNALDSLALQDEPFYSYGAFAYQRSRNLYSPSSECYEYLETQDSDIMAGTDERVLYEKMIVLGQETYCRIRRYIIMTKRVAYYLLYSLMELHDTYGVEFPIKKLAAMM